MTAPEQDDLDTAYGVETDRGGTASGGGPDPDSSPDDFGPEAIGGEDVNPDTGLERGALDNGSAGR
jgi:hypothetical protein